MRRLLISAIVSTFWLTMLFQLSPAVSDQQIFNTSLRIGSIGQITSLKELVSNKDFSSSGEGASQTQTSQLLQDLCEGDCTRFGDNIPTINTLPLWGPFPSVTLPGNLPDIIRTSVTCDSGLVLNSSDPVEAAKAIDICKTSSGEGDWGLVSASWVMADGSAAVSNSSYALGHGILSNFGPNVPVRNGANLLALSSGTARRPTDPGFVDVAGTGYDKGYTGFHPVGFPKAEVSCLGLCPLTSTPHDVAALKVVLRTPVHATGLSFDFKFYSSDYPDWVCSTYNDKFLAMLDPIPVGQIDGNIAFDAMGNPVSVNSQFIQVCGPSVEVPCYSCLLGTSQLQMTGFEGHASTDWQTAAATVEPGSQISLIFAIYDSGDGLLDSTVLIDNFTFIVEPYHYWLPLVERN